MVTILLQKIIELLTGFFGDFIEWANTVGDKIASIKDNTDSLPDIETNTDSIMNDTSTIKGYVNTITTNTTLMHGKITTIRDNTNVISNNVNSIATSSGTTAAFAEDIANNTLNTYDKVTTIASDTTQLRADNQVVQADLDKIYDAIRWSLINVPMTETESGASPLIFNTDMAEKLNYLKCEIEAVETGTGTKSPSNPYTISSISDLDLSVNGVQTTIALGQTVYGGEIVLTKKASGYGVKLRVDRKVLTLDGSQTDVYVNAPYIKSDACDGAWIVNDIYPSLPSVSPRTNVISDKLTYSNSAIWQETNKVNTWVLNEKQIHINIDNDLLGITDYTQETTTTAKNKILAFLTNNPITLIYPIEPIEIDLTDASDIVALVGVNTISSNGNGDITVTYTESVKHYLDKQEA